MEKLNQHNGRDIPGKVIYELPGAVERETRFCLIYEMYAWKPHPTERELRFLGVGPNSATPTE